MKRDRAKYYAWKRRSVRKYKEQLRRDVLNGERSWNSIPPTNPERRKRERERAYGPPERREWVQGQPSVVSGRTPCVNAHVPDPEGPSGMGRKADARWVVPLTLEEEMELHRVGIETFQARHDIDLTEAARETERQWKERGTP